MQDIYTIIQILERTGYHVVNHDSSYLYIVDPACPVPAFFDLIEYAWIILCVITCILLFGWGVTLIRGAGHAYFKNLRDLILIFSTVSAGVPIVNFIWGDDIKKSACETMQISITDLQNIQVKSLENPEYESIQIYDSFANDNQIDLTDSDIQELDKLIENAESVIEYDDTSETNENFDTTISENELNNINVEYNSNNINENKSVSAQKTGNKEVVYVYPDGTRKKFVGGTLAWRHNNPGNLRDAKNKLARIDGFAVFSNYEDGFNALINLLNSNFYQKLTLGDAISKYAPASENNTNKYQRDVEQKTGLSLNTPMSNLNQNQIKQLADTIAEIEGYKRGTIIDL